MSRFLRALLLAAGLNMGMAPALAAAPAFKVDLGEKQERSMVSGPRVSSVPIKVHQKNRILHADYNGNGKRESWEMLTVSKKRGTRKKFSAGKGARTIDRFVDKADKHVYTLLQVTRGDDNGKKVCLDYDVKSNTLLALSSPMIEVESNDKYIPCTARAITSRPKKKGARSGHDGFRTGGVTYHVAFNNLSNGIGQVVKGTDAYDSIDSANFSGSFTPVDISGKLPKVDPVVPEVAQVTDSVTVIDAVPVETNPLELEALPTPPEGAELQRKRAYTSTSTEDFNDDGKGDVKFVFKHKGSDDRGTLSIASDFSAVETNGLELRLKPTKVWLDLNDQRYVSVFSPEDSERVYAFIQGDGSSGKLVELEGPDHELNDYWQFNTDKNSLEAIVPRSGDTNCRFSGYVGKDWSSHLENNFKKQYSGAWDKIAHFFRQALFVVEGIDPRSNVERGHDRVREIESAELRAKRGPKAVKVCLGDLVTGFNIYRSGDHTIPGSMKLAHNGTFSIQGVQAEEPEEPEGPATPYKITLGLDGNGDLQFIGAKNTGRGAGNLHARAERFGDGWDKKATLSLDLRAFGELANHYLAFDEDLLDEADMFDKSESYGAAAEVSFGDFTLRGGYSQTTLTEKKVPALKSEVEGTITEFSIERDSSSDGRIWCDPNGDSTFHTRCEMSTGGGLVFDNGTFAANMDYLYTETMSVDSDLYTINMTREKETRTRVIDDGAVKDTVVGQTITQETDYNIFNALLKERHQAGGRLEYKNENDHIGGALRFTHDVNFSTDLDKRTDTRTVETSRTNYVNGNQDGETISSSAESGPNASKDVFEESDSSRQVFDLGVTGGIELVLSDATVEEGVKKDDEITLRLDGQATYGFGKVNENWLMASDAWNAYMLAQLDSEFFTVALNQTFTNRVGSTTLVLASQFHGGRDAYQNALANSYNTQNQNTFDVQLEEVIQAENRDADIARFAALQGVEAAVTATYSGHSNTAFDVSLAYGNQFFTGVVFGHFPKNEDPSGGATVILDPKDWGTFAAQVSYVPENNSLEGMLYYTLSFDVNTPVEPAPVVPEEDEE